MNRMLWMWSTSMFFVWIESKLVKFLLHMHVYIMCMLANTDKPIYAYIYQWKSICVSKFDSTVLAHKSETDIIQCHISHGTSIYYDCICRDLDEGTIHSCYDTTISSLPLTLSSLCISHTMASLHSWVREGGKEWDGVWKGRSEGGIVWEMGGKEGGGEIVLKEL